MKIEMLKEEIAEAQRKAAEAHELIEETQLKALNKEYEDLMKRKEEQDEKLLNHKTYNNKLFKQQEMTQKTITGQLQRLEQLNSEIIKAKDE